MMLSRRLVLLLCGVTAISIALLAFTVTSAKPSRKTLAAFRSKAGISDYSLSTQITPEPDETPDPASRLARPPISDPPTQIELGHYAYWFSCMVCHGDRGQGLTDEWRNVNPMPDRDCWQSKCHAPNHPPEGFEIPREAPPVIGPGTLSAFQTAADLYEYLRIEMPWAYPGLLPDEEYWQLTAYLADVNGVPLNNKPLGPDNAANISMRVRLTQGRRSAIEVERLLAALVSALLLSTVILRRWIQAG